MNKENNTKICLVCHKIYQKRYREGLRDWKIRKFCSLKCANIGKKRRQRKIFNYCELCRKLLKDNKAKRCNSCRRIGIKHTIKTKLQISKDRKGKCIGIGNPNWKQGISKLPYAFDFDTELKEQIRKRDNYTCQKCSITEEEHIIVYGIKLSVHHIDYNKQNCDEDNLIALCNECNTRVNFNRNHWTEYFEIIIKTRAEVTKT